MTKTDGTVNPAAGFAALRNVSLAMETMKHIVESAPNLPRMGVFFGRSGDGKSSAAAVVANQYRCVYVECRSYFTKKSLLLAILEELGVRPAKTIYEMVNQIGQELIDTRSPLILDEMDHIVEKRGLVELVRDVYHVSNTPILMIGEEQFPKRLKRWERFDNRILDWTPAEACDLADAKKLARVYAPGVTIADDLLQEIVNRTRGVTRRVCVNIEQVRVEVKNTSPTGGGINLATWGSRPFFTGEAPVRRAP